MSGDTSTGSGLTRRRRRLSDVEVEQRMLRAATDMVNETGLTVSLEHINFVDIIRAAGVAHSAVYRRWPSKEMFFSDLLKELAKGTSPTIAENNPEAAHTTSKIILDHLDWVRDPGRRSALIAEILRQGALRELDFLRNSVAWRSYIALHATLLSLPDGDLRTEVQARLTTSERELTARLAEAYRYYAELVGCRLRPELGVTFDDLARLVNATMRGLVVMAPSSPDLATRMVHANPFAAPEPADWSQPALSMASILLTFVEPDPTVEFDADRIAALRASLAAGPPPH